MEGCSAIGSSKNQKVCPTSDVNSSPKGQYMKIILRERYHGYVTSNDFCVPLQVVILSDPDSHEICFVGSEAFEELSRVDPKADELLDGAMAKDKSKEWFQKKGIEKGKA